MRGPIRWFGGKGLMVAKLLPLMPPCRRYCEPFCGGAAMFFARPPVEIETLNDLDGGLIGFFRVLADPEQFELSLIHIPSPRDGLLSRMPSSA